MGNVISYKSDVQLFRRFRCQTQEYFEITQTEDEIAGYRPIYVNMIAEGFKQNDLLNMTDFTEIFEGKLTRNQVKYMIEKLVKDNVLTSEGTGKGTKYRLNVVDAEGDLFDLIKEVYCTPHSLDHNFLFLSCIV